METTPHLSLPPATLGHSCETQTHAPLLNPVCIQQLLGLCDGSINIDALLTFLGTCLHADRISIIKIVHGKANTSHEWVAAPQYSQPPYTSPLPADSLDFSHAHNVHNIFFGYNSAPFAHQGTARIPAAFIACPLQQKHSLIGILLIEHYHDCPWGQEEARPLAFVSQCLATAFLQQKVIQRLLMKQKNSHNLLDWIPFFIFVIDPQDFTLLYINDAVVRAFPQATLGKTCHQIIWGKQNPCSFCPSRSLGTDRYLTKTVAQCPFGENVDIYFSEIQWENKRPVYAALVKKHSTTEKEYANQLHYQAFVAAMHSAYDYVFDIDLTTGDYKIISFQEKTFLDTQLKGSYQKDLHYIDQYVHPDYQAKFKSFFSLEAMRQGSACSLEFLSRTPQGYRWKIRQSFPYTLENGAVHVLSLIKDIHETRIKELEKGQEESNIKLALRNSYTRLFLLHLDTGEFTHIIKNNEVLQSTPTIENFITDINQYGNTLVHPEDRDAFFSFYSLAGIAQAIANNTTLTLEYRILNKNNDYRWCLSFIEPLLSTPNKAMVLIRDITQRRALEEKQRELEIRYATVFKQSCDICFEINLDNAQYTCTVFSNNETNLPSVGSYAGILAQLALLVHPQDKKTFDDHFTLAALQTACHQQHSNFTVYYRLNHPQLGYRWKEARTFFLYEHDEYLAIILVYDIHQQKLLEIKKATDQQRFDLAIRNNYCEINAINLQQDTWECLFSSGHFTDISHHPVTTIIQSVVHPQDRQRVAAVFHTNNLRQHLALHGGEVLVEYRRLCNDGTYHWANATLVPTKNGSGEECTALLLIQDIHEKKLQEQRQRIANQYTHALRNRYDIIDKIDVVQQRYRIFYHKENTFVMPPPNGTIAELKYFLLNHSLHLEDRVRFKSFFQRKHIERAFKTGKEFLIEEFRRLRVDGSYCWVSLTLFPIKGNTPKHKIYMLFTMDISAQKEAQKISQQHALLAKQRLDDERYRTILEQTDTLVFEWWEGKHKQFIPAELVARFAGNYNGRNLLQIWQEDEVIAAEDVYQLSSLRESLQKGASHAIMTVRLRKRTGNYIWCRIAISCSCDIEEKGPRFIGTLNDVDAATKSLMELRFRSEYDVLTKLYNMSAFYAHAEKQLRTNTQTPYCIIRIDIDRFKVINDLYGLTAGDTLLQFIAKGIQQFMGKDDIAGRISGDIFCLLAAGSHKDMIHFVHAITAYLDHPPLPCKVKPSFGICTVGDHTMPINVLCDWANLALTTVKGNYARNYAFYNLQLRDKMLEEKRIENEMHQALHEGQFILYLQPKVDIATSQIIGAEGLVRWLHPTEGLIYPDRFIPLFEKNGFILQLDTAIWEQACQVLHRWIQAGLTPPPISINMSRAHIHDPLLIQKLDDLTQKYAIPPRLLELEITESVFLENESAMYSTMNQLRKKGFLFSMDDFGSGYSSLNVLKNIPVDFIKIDRGFLNEVSTTEKGKTVIRYSIAMAKEMDIGVIAEGVENTQQAAFLLQAGCRYAQGYLYSRPISVEQFEHLAFHKNQPPFDLDGTVAQVAAHIEQGDHSIS